jgi:hypothetical protein
MPYALAMSREKLCIEITTTHDQQISDFVLHLFAASEDPSDLPIKSYPARKRPLTKLVWLANGLIFFT